MQRDALVSGFEKVWYKIRKQITRYENKTLPMPDEAEQIDFTNVNWYINAHLFDKITPCFNLPEKRQRDYARRSLLEAVYSEAGANTDAKKKYIIKHSFPVMNHIGLRF